MPPDRSSSGNPAEAAGDEISKRVLRISLARLGQLAAELARRENGPLQMRCAQSTTAPALVPIRTPASSTHPPLFLMHPVGGSVMAYYQLARYLRPEQPVFAIENQVTFNPAAKLYRGIPEMAARYVEDIRAVRARGPYLLGGYSMGGLIAFEIARQMRANGHEVRLLAIIDTPAHIAASKTTHDSGALTICELMMMTNIIAKRAERDVSVSSDELELLAPDEQVNYILELLKAQHIVPSHVDGALFRDLLAVIRNNELAQRRYEPEPYDGPIELFRAVEVSPELEPEVGQLSSDPAFGWQALCSARVTVNYVPGSHMHVMNQPHVQALGASLQRRIDQELRRRFVNLH